ncbi:MAG: zinc transporter ZupT [Lentisphaerae bacterium]|jgi:ZIP family zinc transporter|nr:zinc transporter ZupT [Lentisphaerota bacterium]
MNPVFIAFSLTLLAGMATGIGSIIAFAASRTNFRFLSVAAGFSAGVMLYVSFVEILVKGGAALARHYGQATGNWLTAGAFFAGILLIGLIDNLIPAAENPHEAHADCEGLPLRDKDGAPCPETDAADGQPLPAHVHSHSHSKDKLMRTGLFTALAIGIHNFPEGLATFMAALHEPSLGVAIAIAIALHNIPEGISVSVPIFYATGSRRRAFIYSFLSGLAEPVGALIAYFILRLVIGCEDCLFSDKIMGYLFAGVAGIMVYISVDELIPTSQAYGKGHDSIFGLVAGMAVMALSLLLMQ